MSRSRKLITFASRRPIFIAFMHQTLYLSWPTKVLYRFIVQCPRIFLKNQFLTHLPCERKVTVIAKVQDGHDRRAWLLTLAFINRITLKFSFVFHLLARAFFSVKIKLNYHRKKLLVRANFLCLFWQQFAYFGNNLNSRG